MWVWYWKAGGGATLATGDVTASSARALFAVEVRGALAPLGGGLLGWRGASTTRKFASYPGVKSFRELVILPLGNYPSISCQPVD